MTFKLQKIGNSYMVTVPSDVVRSNNLKVGDEMNLKVDKDRLVYLKAQKPRQLGGRFSVVDFNQEESTRFLKEGKYER
ncbi:MAG: AbrB/MazE/SpoVT family DNA-binding domain-containing protein [Candidatus Dojkabacteria bacterium]